jgi:methionyl-tRNA formyltransferase
MAEKKSKNIRIIFMGTSVFADVILNSLLDEKYSIVGVYTQPDKKTGRNQNLSKSAVKITAEKNNLDLFQPERFDESSIDELKRLKPDLIIVAAYGKILPQKLLGVPKFGCLNVHASLLPKYRGPSPIQNVLLNGEKETGSTIMLMNAGIDTGDILSQEKLLIHPNETFSELLGRLAGISSSLLLETLPQWAEGKIKPTSQDDSQASLCKLIEKDDGHILWSDDALAIYNIYRALHSWPGIFSYWERETEKVRIKLNKIELIETSDNEPHHLGEVRELSDGKIGVQTSKGIVVLKEIQLEGKKNTKAESFINGYPDFVGSILK